MLPNLEILCKLSEHPGNVDFLFFLAENFSGIRCSLIQAARRSWLCVFTYIQRYISEIITFKYNTATAALKIKYGKTKFNRMNIVINQILLEPPAIQTELSIDAEE